MRVQNWLLCLALLAAAPVAEAANRYDCAADDAVLRLALDVEFSADTGGKLTHFRGGYVLKDKLQPSALRALTLDSGMLTQRWNDDDRLLMRLYQQAQEKPPFGTLDMTIAVAAGAEGAPWDGTYALTVATAPDTASKPAVQLQKRGKIACSPR